MAIEGERKPNMLENLDQRIRSAKIIEAKKTYDNHGLLEQVCKNYQEYQSKRSKPGNIILDFDLLRIGLGNTPPSLTRWLKVSGERRLNTEIKAPPPPIMQQQTKPVVAAAIPKKQAKKMVGASI
jgi:hypothetical protein